MHLLGSWGQSPVLPTHLGAVGFSGQAPCGFCPIIEQRWGDSKDPRKGSHVTTHSCRSCPQGASAGWCYLVWVGGPLSPYPSLPELSLGFPPPDCPMSGK